MVGFAQSQVEFLTHIFQVPVPLRSQQLIDAIMNINDYELCELCNIYNINILS